MIKFNAVYDMIIIMTLQLVILRINNGRMSKQKGFYTLPFLICLCFKNPASFFSEKGTLVN